MCTGINTGAVHVYHFVRLRDRTRTRGSSSLDQEIILVAKDIRRREIFCGKKFVIHGCV